jgi:hypothetical protein
MQDSFLTPGFTNFKIRVDIDLDIKIVNAVLRSPLGPSTKFSFMVI